MELKEFIKTAITDITEAVSELQAELENGAIVNPSLPSPITNTTVIDPENNKINKPISTIDFDVAITVADTETRKAGGKLGIQILSANIGSDNKTNIENVSRMTFSIPVVLPAYHVKSAREIEYDAFQSRRSNRLSDNSPVNCKNASSASNIAE